MHPPLSSLDTFYSLTFCPFLYVAQNKKRTTTSLADSLLPPISLLFFSPCILPSIFFLTSLSVSCRLQKTVVTSSEKKERERVDVTPDLLQLLISRLSLSLFSFYAPFLSPPKFLVDRYKTSFVRVAREQKKEREKEEKVQ